MFFDYRVLNKTGNKKLYLNDASVQMYKTENEYVGKYLNEICAMSAKAEGADECKYIIVELGLSEDVKAKINALGEKYDYNDEAYYIELGEKTLICGETERAVIYALETVKRFILDDELSQMTLFDYPAIAKRGFHSFVPGRDQLDDYKKMIDNLLVYYKFNFIMFEVGGAMEYKRHPKINEEWSKFSQAMLADSGIADKLQHYTYPWSKNAIHPENGKGSFLTQEEMKDLVMYCRERGLDVIPEVPSLSHADYIVRAYPEINERVADRDPDTYCPSNPKSYEIMYDILDEVAEVFDGSEYVAIGHDELVTIGICDKCKGKDPATLFASDVKKLYDYITKKGMKVMMYGDKFTKLYKDGKSFEESNGEPYIDNKGKLCGGLAGYPEGDERHVPALFHSLELMPKDIIILDWYWSFNFDETFKERTVMYANFKANSFKNWKARMHRENLIGICESNWGPNDYNNMQRNNIFNSMMFNAYTSWSKNYDDSLRDEASNKVLLELNAYYRNFILKYSKDKKYISVCHTTDHYMPFRSFYDGDFVKEEDYHMGDYVVEYADGSSMTEPVIYGKNISNCKLDIDKHKSALCNVSGATVAEAFGEDMYYHWMFENKYPDKEIKEIKFVTSGKFDADVTTKTIHY